ncbi:MAG: hypothetical protein ABWY93_18640 [Mycobacterium sp.]
MPSKVSRTGGEPAVVCSCGHDDGQHFAGVGSCTADSGVDLPCECWALEPEVGLTELVLDRAFAAGGQRWI